MIILKRWQTTCQEKTTLIYAHSPEECREKWGVLVDDGADITPYTSTEHLDYINKIKDKSEFIKKQVRKNGYEERELYKCTCFCGWCYVMFTKDLRDNTYCDCVHYQLYEYGRFVEPVTWNFVTPKYFYENILDVQEVRYIEHSFRKFGEPKLSKPSELKGIKSVGSVDFIPKHCKPQLFIKDKDVWVKHTDYFSPAWRPPAGERIDMPTSYYLNKYFGTKCSKEKFIYPDCWDSIILRNECWLVLENLVPLLKCRDMNSLQVARKILQKQKMVVGGMSDEVTLEWERYWERVVNFLKGVMRNESRNG